MSTTPNLTRERTATGKRRWIPISESPFSRQATYEALEAGWFESVVIQFPGSKRVRRFIDSESVDRYFEKLMKEQQGSPFTNTGPKRRKISEAEPQEVVAK